VLLVDSDFSGTEGTFSKEGIAKGGLKDSASSVDGTYVESLDPEVGYGPSYLCKSIRSEHSWALKISWF
jgi:hypothetical protein